MEMEWGKISNVQINSMAYSHISRYLFTGDANGELKQFNVKDKHIEKDFGQVHDGAI